MWNKFKAQFREQVWNHEQMVKVRQSFAQLDTQTQSYVLIGSFAAFAFVMLMSLFMLWGRAISVKNEIASMDATIRYMQTSGTRITELQEQATQESADPLLDGFDAEAPLAAMLAQAGQKSLIAKGNVSVTEGDNGTRADLKLNKISLTQLVRMLYLIEESGAGAVVDHLSVDAKEDTQGFLWATMSVRKPAGNP
ncbi:MAG: hypothetical protein EOP11_25975 [Proteobacteria bacterium]|nr:MAG: hypothetical protein EOP11_25975 [Pseudomonadota bacterium]